MKKQETELQDDTLYEHYSFTAAKGQLPLRVDKYLLNFIENATRSKIQQAAKNGHIRINGIIVKSNHKVKANDTIKILFEHPPYEFLLVPENIPLTITFEDDHLLVVNKPAGMVVHPGHGNYNGTLINALIYHFDNLPQNTSGRPGLVHRIDKDTSGLLVIAKTDVAMYSLAKQFFNKTIERTYNAIVWGNVEADEGTVRNAVGRHPKNRLQMTIFEDGKSGKDAVTHYKVLQRYGYVTLICCTLETGRTHQIRVHMKSIGHTIFNDERYGGHAILKGTTFTKYKQFVENCFKIMPRQALHAKTLGFEHPITGKHIRFDSELPEDMLACISKWDTYTKRKKE